MLRAIIKQVLQGGLTLWMVITITFFLIRVLPGGPFDQDRKLPPAIEANMEAKYHLDEPVFAQYIRYVSQLLQGDLGPSYKYMTRNVNAIVSEASSTSITLGAMALLVGIFLGMVLGTWAGSSPNRHIQNLLVLVGTTSVSLPSFIFGACLTLVFAYYLNVLPAARLEGPLSYVLPVLTLSLTPFAYTFLLIRARVLELMTMPFVQSKHSFGLSEFRVVFLHVLRNALIPLVSILGPISAATITGSFAVELIFAIPGLGKYFITAVSNRDYTLVMGITIVYSTFLVVFNTITEMLLGFLDPRIRADEEPT